MAQFSNATAKLTTCSLDGLALSFADRGTHAMALEYGDKLANCLWLQAAQREDRPRDYTESSSRELCAFEVALPGPERPESGR